MENKLVLYYLINDLNQLYKILQYCGQERSEMDRFYTDWANFIRGF